MSFFDLFKNADLKSQIERLHEESKQLRLQIEAKTTEQSAIKATINTLRLEHVTFANDINKLESLVVDAYSRIRLCRSIISDQAAPKTGLKTNRQLQSELATAEKTIWTIKDALRDKNDSSS